MYYFRIPTVLPILIVARAATFKQTAIAGNITLFYQ